MSTFNLVRIRELLPTFEARAKLGPLLAVWIDSPLDPLERALGKALSERPREDVIATLQALTRWGELRGLGQDDVGLAELKARVDALYEVDDTQSQVDAELLDALLARLVLITAPAGVLDALRASVRKGGQ